MIARVPLRFEFHARHLGCRHSFYISQSAFQIIQTIFFRKQRGSKIIWNKPCISEIVGLLICFFEKRFGQFHPGKNDFENRNLANFDMRYRKKLGLIFN